MLVFDAILCASVGGSKGLVGPRSLRSRGPIISGGCIRNARKYKHFYSDKKYIQYLWMDKVMFIFNNVYLSNSFSMYPSPRETRI